MSMENSILRADIHRHDLTRRRVVAIVMNARWDDPQEDVRAPLELEEIMWAVASNDTILSGVAERMMSSDDPMMTDGPIGTIPDADLEYTVISEALPRLVREAENKPRVPEAGELVDVELG